MHCAPPRLDAQEHHAYLEELRRDAIERGVPWSKIRMAPLCAVAVTGKDGRFDVIVKVPWAIAYVDGRQTSPSTPPPRSAIEEFRIEIEGQEAQVITIPKQGTWTEHPEGAEKHGVLWATWELGDVGL